MTDDNFSTATYFDGSVYYIGQNDNIRQFALSNGLLSTLPIELSDNYFGNRGAQAVVSANGTHNGVLWAIECSTGGGNGILHAYDANDVGNELYNTAQANGNRDAFGPAVRFAVPTVINGRVYVGGQNQLAIFGDL